MSKEKIFITGGTGFLGKAIIEELHDMYGLVVFSRDESKQYFLKKQYPNVEFKIGDIRNLDLMRRAAKGCNKAIFCASMKQISACDENPEEAAEIILNGAINSRKVAEDNEMESATFISTDKSRAATTLYGALKFAATESFILNPDRNGPVLNSVLYGNVFGSSGSIIPLLESFIKEGREAVLFGEEMTRFGITGSEAVDLVFKAITVLPPATIIVPNLWSFKVKDIFEIYQEEKGLKFKVGKPRVGEKIHEIMISEEECARTTKFSDDIYLIHPAHYYLSEAKRQGEFSSRDCTITKEDLRIFLKQQKFL